MIQRSLPVLVVANSARMLTKLLVDNDFTVIAIDCYGDTDTEANAMANFCLDRLEGVSFRQLLMDIRDKYAVQYVFYGSGLEYHPLSLLFLEQHFTVVGNKSERVMNLQNKPAFFQTLLRNGLPFPNVSFDSPNPDQKGLFKPYDTFGGMGVVFDSAPIAQSQEFYWQEYIAGEPYSVTFLANGDRYKILGFNRQRIQQINEQPFVFCGLIAQIELSAHHQQQLASYLDVLLKNYCLVGLCSLDFMIKNEQIFLLEINSRIPASAQLYDSQIIIGHLNACLNGTLPEILPVSEKKALHIVYSEEELQIPVDVIWPDWVFDRPYPSCQISQNQPICSIIIEYSSLDNVEASLKHCEHLVKNLLSSGS